MQQQQQLQQQQQKQKHQLICILRSQLGQARLSHGIEALSMTTHLQGRSSRGPGTIARSLTTLSSFGPSSSSSSSSRSSSKAEPDAIELHEWKPTPAPEKSSRSSPSRQDVQQHAASNASTPPVVGHGGAFLRWLRGKSGGVWWGPLFLLLLFLLLIPNSPSAAEAAASEPSKESLVGAWLEGNGATDEERFETPEGAPEQGRGTPEVGTVPTAEEEVPRAPTRRLSGISAWAADIEASLRLSPRLSLYLGVFLTLSGSLLMAGGSTLMKLGLSVEEIDSLRGQSCDQQWLWGFAGEPGSLLVARARSFVFLFLLLKKQRKRSLAAACTRDGFALS